MLDDKDVKKFIKAMADVFPTAEMVNAGFEKTATKEQVEKLEEKLDNAVEKQDEGIRSLTGKVKVLEEALEIE